MSPIFISPAPSDRSCKQAVSSCESEKYFSMIPAEVSVPVISSSVRRVMRRRPLSLTIRSNCSQLSMKRVMVSLSVISFGMMKFRVRALKLLVVRLRSLVVLVRNR